MTDKMKLFIEEIKSISVDYKTPFDTNQHVIFCNFRKLRMV